MTLSRSCWVSHFTQITFVYARAETFPIIKMTSLVSAKEHITCDKMRSCKRKWSLNSMLGENKLYGLCGTSLFILRRRVRIKVFLITTPLIYQLLQLLISVAEKKGERTVNVFRLTTSTHICLCSDQKSLSSKPGCSYIYLNFSLLFSSAPTGS